MALSNGPESKHVEAHGLNLHYLDWDGDSLPPMLLLHGLQDCAGLWDDFAAAMRSRYHVIALDHRGHGDSPWTAPERYKLADYVAEVKGVIEALDLRDIVLMGHSAGSKNAWIYIAENPGRVSRLVITDMDPDSYNPGSREMIGRYKGESDEYDTLEAVVERLRDRARLASDDLLRRHAAHLTRPLPSGKLTWKRDRNVVTHYDRPDAWHYLPQVNAPTLIVRGSISTLLTRPVAKRMNEQIPDGRLVELEGGHHWVHHEFPAQYQRVVREFLDS